MFYKQSTIVLHSVAVPINAVGLGNVGFGRVGGDVILQVAELLFTVASATTRCEEASRECGT